MLAASLMLHGQLAFLLLVSTLSTLMDPAFSPLSVLIFPDAKNPCAIVSALLPFLTSRHHMRAEKSHLLLCCLKGVRPKFAEVIMKVV